jgi:antitoxin component YwqK of YwqJK toxin-antitoxin module
MKLKTRIVFFCLLILPSVGLIAQPGVVNLLDSEGRRTGKWIKYYDNGKLWYEGNFLEGKPVGLMKRYYRGGFLQAEIKFLPADHVSYARLFYEDGNLAAEGKYISEKKDSTWQFYSFYNKRLAIREDYLNGVRHGRSEKYYDNGGISEITEWLNGKKHGDWLQYYENGQVRLKCTHRDDLREGSFEAFSFDGKPTITGSYAKGLMDGSWTYYGEGDSVMVFEYMNGVMLPNPEYDKLVDEFSRKVDESVGAFPESAPDGLLSPE